MWRINSLVPKKKKRRQKSAWKLQGWSISVARRPCRYKAIEIATGCLCACICMSVTFVATKDEDGDTCLVVFGRNARKRCLPLWHRFFSILVDTRFDLDSRIRGMEIRFSVKAVGVLLYREFCGHVAVSLIRFDVVKTVRERSFVREWFFIHRFLRVFTYFLVSLWIPWKIIATWFSLSLFFLRFQSDVTIVRR